MCRDRSRRWVSLYRGEQAVELCGRISLLHDSDIAGYRFLADIHVSGDTEISGDAPGSPVGVDDEGGSFLGSVQQAVGSGYGMAVQMESRYYVLIELVGVIATEFHVTAQEEMAPILLGSVTQGIMEGGAIRSRTCTFGVIVQAYGGRWCCHGSSEWLYRKA